jgi:hypothetical protein
MNKSLLLAQAVALRYADRGWPVFPVATPMFDTHGRCVGCSCEQYRRSNDCKRKHPHLYLGPKGKCANPGKCPRVRWSEKSTVDPVQIKRWWGSYWQDVNIETGRITENVPNVGIDCGKAGLLVFDADTYKHFCGDLSDLFSVDERQTVTVITGGGGEHLWFDRQGKPYGNSTKGLPPGVDIRGLGGYIVAPPSLHKSGRRYQFETGYGPRDLSLLPIPPKLDEILAAATPRSHRRGEIRLVTPALLRRSVRAVERLLEGGELAHSGQLVYGDGFRWILDSCPFNPADDPHGEDASAFIIVLPDGRIGAGCHHNRCQKRIEEADSGWKLLCDLVGYQSRRRQVLVEVVR